MLGLNLHKSGVKSSPFLNFKGVKMLIMFTCSLSGPCLCLHCCLSFFIKLHFCTESRDSRLVIDMACQQSLHHSVFNVPFHVSNFECTYIQILIRSEYRETVYVNAKYVIKEIKANIRADFLWWMKFFIATAKMWNKVETHSPTGLPFLYSTHKIYIPIQFFTIAKTLNPILWTQFSKA